MKTNRLIHETSPYLQQHAKNPVDWYPWGTEALEKSKSENKPICLSIGYSACHWCHVMEHESFENASIAQIMNENFVNIKVDREERPDLDHIYQNVAQLLTHGGGWPLTVFLTPDLKPFFGGTYFPPDDRYGRPGFFRVLKSIADSYQNDPAGIEHNASRLMTAISEMETLTIAEKRSADLAFFKTSANSILESFDWKNGGFGVHPKFPNPMALTFLWRFGTLTSFEKAQEATLLALVKMAQGGIYDQLGGGFHRYSVDESWSIPHFEKMLYDNALLIQLYSEVLLSAQNDYLKPSDQELLINTLSETVDYILREMTSPSGGFYSAQDADTEGEEGKFFAWKKSDIEKILTKKDSDIFSLRYGVSIVANFEHGQTVLYKDYPIQEISERLKMPKSEVLESLNKSKKILFDLREKREHPLRDEKILTSWNGLMISALSWASLAFEKYDLSQQSLVSRNAAFKAYGFIKLKLSQPYSEKNNKYRLFSNFKDGISKNNAYLDDYAFMAKAAIDLTRISKSAEELNELYTDTGNWLKIIINHFKDQNSSGYFFTSDDHEKLIQRPKTIFDQAIPSGTAVALECMSIISEINQSFDFKSEVNAQLLDLNKLTERSPQGMAAILNASLLHALGPVIVSTNLDPKDAYFIFRKPDAKSNTVCHRLTCFEKSQSEFKVWLDNYNL